MRKYPERFIGAFGLHPWYYNEENFVDELEKKLLEFPNAMVGEIGVDELKEPVCDKQHVLFYIQMDLAKKYKRSVVTHAAKAFDALKKHKKDLCEVKFVHHGFVKNIEILKFVNECGGYVGLGSLFLKQEKAKEFWAVMDKKKILFETDVPYRVAEDNYFNHVDENLSKLAIIAEMDKNDLVDMLNRNAEEFLR
jgi:Tat protein secretion system quality control protein TatD with DNase activity